MVGRAGVVQVAGAMVVAAVTAGTVHGTGAPEYVSGAVGAGTLALVFGLLWVARQDGAHREAREINAHLERQAEYRRAELRKAQDGERVMVLAG